MLGPGHRVSDRRADRLDNAGHPKMPAAGFDIYPHLDGQEQRLQLIRAHSGKHPPYGRRIIGLRASQDFQQGIALAFIGALIDDHLHRAFAFVDRAGPACYENGA